MKKKQPRNDAGTVHVAEIQSVTASETSKEDAFPVWRRPEQAPSAARNMPNAALDKADPGSSKPQEAARGNGPGGAQTSQAKAQASAAAQKKLEDPLFSHGDLRQKLPEYDRSGAATGSGTKAQATAREPNVKRVGQEGKLQRSGQAKPPSQAAQPSILEQASQKNEETLRQTRSAYAVHKQRMLDRKRARRKRRRISFLVTLAVLAVLSFLVYILPIFHVRQIEVVGNRHVQAAALAEAAEVKIGGHLLQGWGGNLMQILTLRNSAAEERIKERFPYVEDVKVGIKLPYTTLITVEERIPVSYVQVEGGVALLDKNGILLEVLQSGPPSGIPLIQNVALKDLTPGHVLSPATKEEIRSAMLLLDALIRSDAGANDGFNLLSQVLYIRPDSKGNCYITLREPYAMPETSFRLGEVQTLDVSLTWLRYLVRTMKVSELGKGILDLDTKVFKIEEEVY